MSLRAVNLNLIPILQALLRHRSVTEAAKSLQLTQPTVSVALAHLRALLDDPLLVRVGRRTALTPRALGLIAAVEDACAAMEGVLQPIAFDPARAQRTITIGTADHIPGIIGPALAAALQAGAPGIAPHFIAYSTDIGERHRMGEIDFLIMPRRIIELSGYAELRIRRLFTERFVHVVGPSHPLAGKAAPTQQDIECYPTAIFSPSHVVPRGVGADYGFDDLVRPDPVGPRVALRTAHIGALPMIAAVSDLVATAPLLLVERLAAGLGLRIIGDPLPPIEICLTWSPLLESDAAHRFFRTLLTSVVNEPG
jgi:DNA-binding transcriptional LysR family regulator